MEGCVQVHGLVHRGVTPTNKVVWRGVWRFAKGCMYLL